MGTDRRKRIERNAKGHFLKGNTGGPGRKEGTCTKATSDALAVKKQILAVWDAIDGPERLKQWAIEDFEKFLDVLLRILPKDGPAGPQVTVVVSKQSAMLLAPSEDGSPCTRAKMLERLGHVPIPIGGCFKPLPDVPALPDQD